MKDPEKMADVLYGALQNCRSKEDFAALLSDLCTYQEVEQMAQRAAAAKLLAEGKTYAEIIAETDISSATLSRVSRATAAAAMRAFFPKQRTETGGADSPLFSCPPILPRGRHKKADRAEKV